MAPEQHDCQEFGRSVDIWALGIILYELCQKETPYPTAGKAPMAIVRAFLHPYKEVKPVYSPELRQLIADILKLRPDERPTVDDLRANDFVSKHLKKY